MILKNFIKFKSVYTFALLLSSVIVLSCEEDTREVTLYEKGTVDAIISANPTRNQPVTFESTSTKVVSQSWVFVGGTPATSTDQIATVNYAWGGEYEAKLTVKYIDNQTETKTITFTIAGPLKPVLPALTGTSLGIFTERGAPAFNRMLTPTNNGNFVITADLTNPYEGGTCWQYSLDPVNSGNTQNGFGLSHASLTTSPLNATNYNFLNIAVKTTTNKKIRLRHNTGSGNFWVTLDPAAPAYGMLWDGQWHALKIPLADIKLNGNTTSLSASPGRATISSFTIRTDDSDYAPATAGSFIVSIDDIYLTAI